MTPLAYYLEALDARVNVSIIDLYGSAILTGCKPLYAVLADSAFILKYRNYDVQSVDISKVDEVMNVYIRITK